jgi:hypothetical protein
MDICSQQFLRRTHVIMWVACASVFGIGAALSAQDLPVEFPATDSLTAAPESPVPESPVAALPVPILSGNLPLLTVPAVPPAPGTTEAVMNEAATGELIPFSVGYWIVSTWHSPQSFDDGPLQFRPEVKRFDEGAGIRDSGIEELTHSLIPGVPVCIVVHGSFMSSPSVYPESCDTWQWLQGGSCGLPFQMIYFSWPSDRPLSALASIDVAVLGKRASRNGFYLTSLINKLPPECPLCLLGHSHGTRIISSSLHLMAGGEVEGYYHPQPRNSRRRIRAVFAASAIDHDWLNPGARYERALCVTECLLNLHNHKDPALKIYPLRRIGSSRALGCVGFTEKDQRALGEARRRVSNWDVSEIVGMGHLWPNYVKRPSLASRLRNYLYYADMLHIKPSETATYPTAISIR